MEILKQMNIKRTKKCSLCKSIFVYNMSNDIKGQLYKFVECPVCGELNNISIFDRRYKKGE